MISKPSCMAKILNKSKGDKCSKDDVTHSSFPTLFEARISTLATLFEAKMQSLIL